MKENIKEELKKNFKIKIAFSEVEKKMEEEFLELSKTLKLPGFRPGKPQKSKTYRLFIVVRS